MKKFMKILTVLMIVMMIISTATMVFAAVDKEFDPSGYNGTGGTANVDKISDIGQNIVKVITAIGSIVSVIILMVLGIKYMIGSAEEKAEYKKTLMPYVIGAALVFAASTIASMVFTFVNI